MVPAKTQTPTAARPDAPTRVGNGLLAIPRPALPVLQRQRAPQQLALDLRRR